MRRVNNSLVPLISPSVTRVPTSGGVFNKNLSVCVIKLSRLSGGGGGGQPSVSDGSSSDTPRLSVHTHTHTHTHTHRGLSEVSLAPWWQAAVQMQ